MKRHKHTPRGLLIDDVVQIVSADADWRAVRDCYESSANAARIDAYRARLAESLDPLGDCDVLARRQLAGMRVQAELRRRDRALQLRRRLRAVPTPAPATASEAPSNVVRIGRMRH
ncbi:MAG: hypothetical protein Q8L45_01585 [Xanthomonadaceae bacterium]|nr:hypothetical protein [Xanthomonadaceae bacterium]MDP2185048.1 hypothetical protein [Xanthomonadales bacterium]MDZ4114427.1 hypothetical protein [Xanthomonadaceae bacterium]